MTRIGAVGAMLALLGGGLTDLSKGDLSRDKALAYWSGLSLAVMGLGIRRKLDNPTRPPTVAEDKATEKAAAKA